MRFVETELPGAFLVELEVSYDHRGFFARTWCGDEFSAHGLNPHLAQCNLSYNGKRGTLRGLHYQVTPHSEAKLVQCTAGSLFDVIVDLRPDSPHRGRWRSFELSNRGRRALYVPEGFAHGFQTLEDDTEVLYHVSAPFHPESARGLRWNDPVIDISWPIADPVISDRDRSHPLLVAPLDGRAATQSVLG